MKFCKDCKWFNWLDNKVCGSSFCDRPPIIYDMVNGQVLRRSAHVQRNSLYEDECGKEARFFEAKEES